VDFVEDPKRTKKSSLEFFQDIRFGVPSRAPFSIGHDSTLRFRAKARYPAACNPDYIEIRPAWKLRPPSRAESSGTINEVLPNEYLNNNFERGINKTIKIINGMDLVTFTITISNILCKVLLGFTPFVSDVVSKIPIGSPIIKAIIVEIKTIYMVSHKGWTIV